MTDGQIPLIESDEVEALPDVVPPLDGYILVAYYAPQEWWNTNKGFYLSRGRAEEAANALPKGWIHKHIIHVKIGGDE